MNAPAIDEIVLGVATAAAVLIAVLVLGLLPELRDKRRSRILAPQSGDEDRGPSVGTPSNVLTPHD